MTVNVLQDVSKFKLSHHFPEGLDTSYGLYGKAPPKRGTCTYFQASDIWKVGISLVEVYKRVVKYVFSVCNKPKEAVQKRFVFMIYPHLKYSVFAAVKGMPGS